MASRTRPTALAKTRTASPDLGCRYCHEAVRTAAVATLDSRDRAITDHERHLHEYAPDLEED
jgi:hypothetical protein